MADFVYTNTRGETVVPLHVFKNLTFEAIIKSAGKPYPKKKHRGRSRNRKMRNWK